MDLLHVGWVLALLAGVSVAAWSGQHLLARHVEGQLYVELTSDDSVLTVRYAEPKRC